MAAKLQRIAAPDLPNPATPEEPHRVVPHLLHDQDDGYQDLLELLRRDLQLNPSTDLVPPALASAENKPWAEDAGSVSVAASGTVTVKHRLGRVPVSVVCTTWNNGATPNIGWVVQNPTATQFVIANPTATASSVYWRALG